MMKSRFTSLALLSLLLAAPAGAIAADTDAALPISNLSESGRHFDAIRSYLEIDGNDPALTELIAVARSAWALGLVERARGVWDELLSRPDLDRPDRMNALLGRAVLELQESRYESARAFAEQAVTDLEPSDLRSQFWLIIAESLKAQGISTRAELFYKRAAEEGSVASRAEALYLLGSCQQDLGMLNESRYSLTTIPTDSPHAARALRRLIEIDFKQRDYDGVLTWVSEARESFPAQFDDPWLYYVHISALLELGSIDRAREVTQRFRTRHGPSNHWYLIAESALEAKLLEYNPASPQAQLAPVGEKRT